MQVMNPMQFLENQPFSCAALYLFQRKNHCLIALQEIRAAMYRLLAIGMTREQQLTILCTDTVEVYFFQLVIKIQSNHELFLACAAKIDQSIAWVLRCNFKVTPHQSNMLFTQLE
jgi:hypothetical protein